MAASQTRSGDESDSKYFDADTSLWATHALECQNCETIFPVGYGAKGRALDKYGGVSEYCPECDKTTLCEEA